MKIHWLKAYGLGAFFEFERVAHDVEWKDRPAVICKVVIGPALIALTIPLGAWRVAEPPF